MLLNNNKYFFFAILGISVIVTPQSIFAEIEHGINYDRQLLETKPDGTQIFKWTSTPLSANRILDESGTYQNYIIRQDSNNVYFESAQGSVSFNKSTCTLATYDAGYIEGQPKFKISHTIKQAVNGTDDWQLAEENSLSCNYTMTQTKYAIHLIATKGDFKVIYDIDFNLGFEWTYKYTNTRPEDADKKIGFTVVCDGNQCDDIRLNGFDTNGQMLNKTELIGKKIMVGDMEFDPKDYDHDALWALKKLPNKMIVDFTNAKQPLGYNDVITIDPVFSYTAAQSQQYVQTGATAQCLTSTGSGNGSSGVSARVATPSTGVPDNCIGQLGRWLITSIPDSAIITAANFRHDRGAAGGSANERMLIARNMTLDPQGSATAAQKWVQMTQGNFVISPWTESAAGTNDIVRAFNSNGTTSIQDRLVSNIYGLAVVFVSMKSDASAHNIDNIVNWELEVTYAAIPPNAVTTLAASGTTTTSTNLSWSTPNLNGGTLQRYVIYYTTPCGTPATFLANGTISTSYAVSGLSASTCYSFRTSAATEAGYNFTGNIANVTTLAFNQANYTIGGFSYTADNPLRLPIRYETQILNSTHTLVNVTYTKTFTLNCDLRYTYSATNRTYHNVTGVTISSTEKEASFRMKNPSNEVTTFHCWNNGGNQSANYVLTQSNFLLLQQIQQFRNGTFGTMGQLGAFDFVALVIVIISMIGLNRDNEIVGGIFCLIGISVTAYFGIITWYIAIIAAAAVIIMMMVVSAKKS